MMEKRNGFVVETQVTPASGQAEREAAGRLEQLPGEGSKTLGADKAYDTQAFVETLRARGHPACGAEHGACRTGGQAKASRETGDQGAIASVVSLAHQLITATCDKEGVAAGQLTLYAGRCTSTGTGALVSRHRILIAELTRERCNPTAVCQLSASTPGADPPNHSPPPPRRRHACDTALNSLSLVPMWSFAPRHGWTTPSAICRPPRSSTLVQRVR
jgi:hypothetical protein